MMPFQEHDVLLSIGSNLGDRLANLRGAVRELSPAGAVVKRSSVYETEPVGYADQDYFYNAAVIFRTTLNPSGLMERILDIERRAGRQRAIRFGPRTLDMDIIFYGRRIIREPGLTVPHPEYHHRYFVLLPAAEIAPDWICPVFHVTLSELKERCNDKKWVQRLPDVRLDDENGLSNQLKNINGVS